MGYAYIGTILGTELKMVYVDDIVFVETAVDLVFVEASVDDLVFVEPSVDDLVFVEPSVDDLVFVEPSVDDLVFVEPSVDDIVFGEQFNDNPPNDIVGTWSTLDDMQPKCVCCQEYLGPYNMRQLCSSCTWTIRRFHMDPMYTDYPHTLMD
jgi:hypothetical protein